MGFWGTVEKVAINIGKVVINIRKVVIKEVKVTNDKFEQYKLEMPNKSDNELFSIIKKKQSSPPLQVGAAHQELVKRGYDKNQIVAKLKLYK